MNQTHRTLLINSIVRIGAAAFATVATLATATEVVLVAAAPVTARTYASPEQELAIMQVIGSYDARTRSELLAAARYPNLPEARQQRLEGTVGIAFEIDRQGALQNADIVQSSRSRLLDKAALNSVHWAKYAAFPADLTPGEARRRYTVTFDYRAPAQD